MTKYYCPQHPDQEVYDDAPHNQPAIAGLFTLPQMVQCPVDGKHVYLKHCKQSDGGPQWSR